MMIPGDAPAGDPHFPAPGRRRSGVARSALYTHVCSAKLFPFMLGAATPTELVTPAVCSTLAFSKRRC